MQTAACADGACTHLVSCTQATLFLRPALWALLLPVTVGALSMQRAVES